MPFKKGQSGNPKGPPATVKPWRDALRKACAEVDKSDKLKRRYIQRIAESVRDKAIEGDIQAAKEIGDRLDGRAAPSPEEQEAAKNLYTAIVQRIVDAPDK